MKSAALVVLGMVLTLIASRLFAESPTTQPAPQRVTFYAAIVSPGQAWKDAQAAGNRLDLAEHLAYEKTLRERRKLVMAGPFADGSGGLIIYRAESLDEAEELARNDPATRDKLFAPEIRVWLVNAADAPSR